MLLTAYDFVFRPHAVTVSLKAIGNTPQLTKKKFLVENNRTVGWIHSWLKKTLKLDTDESIVIPIVVW